ncbi:MAG: hypothetical protein ACKVQU_33835 [Burkholderiales bacterium]
MKSDTLKTSDAPPFDPQWAADLKYHTVSKIRARIPPVSGRAGKDHDD